jgi:hypothetical protein
LDALTLPHLPAIGERAHYEPVLNRLKKMRKKRERPDIGNLLLRARAYARSGRPDWIKGKLRWFSEPEELDRIMANVEVEKTIGRSEPQLWSEKSENKGYRSEFNIDERGFSKFNKESAEIWKHQIDPMLAEENYRAPGGKDRNREAIEPGGATGDELPQIKTEKSGSSKRLRLLEVRYSDDIVRTATDVCQEIAQICKKDETENDDPDEVAVSIAATVDVSA